MKDGTIEYSFHNFRSDSPLQGRVRFTGARRKRRVSTFALHSRLCLLLVDDNAPDNVQSSSRDRRLGFTDDLSPSNVGKVSCALRACIKALNSCFGSENTYIYISRLRLQIGNWSLIVQISNRHLNLRNGLIWVLRYYVHILYIDHQCSGN